MLEDFLFETTKLYHNKILNQSESLVKLLHIDKMIHINIDSGDNVLVGCSDIKWLENSISKKYYKTNRGLMLDQNINFEFFCDVNADNCPDSQQEMLVEVKHNYNWHNNFAFCMPNPTDGSRSYVCFGSPKHNQNVYGKIFTNLNQVKSMVVESVNNLNKLYNLAAQQNKVHLSHLIDNEANMATNTTKEKQQLARQFLNTRSEGEGDFLISCPLNDLEKSFFRQYISGINSSIVKILNFDEKFINNLKIKFSCNSEKQLALIGEKLEFLGRI
jgi:hypothetical protein